MIQIIIANLYAVFGLVSLWAYWPQIKRLYKDPCDQKEISIKTWSIWALEGIIALSYGLFCLKDILFCILTLLDLILVFCVIYMVVRNRYVLSGAVPSVLSAAYHYYLKRPFFDVDVSKL